MRLKNRKRYFTQWDRGQILIVDECTPGTQVHFTNTRSEEAYVLEVDQNLEVQVPDVLLQFPFPITAWVYKIENNQYYTESRREFQVIKRARPESYIYTEEEHAYWETKVDKNWGTQNAGKLLVVGDDGIVTISTINDMMISDKYFQFTQNLASKDWIIVHNLNKNPAVTVVDSAGSFIIGEVTYLSENALKISFQAPFTGKAYLN